MDDASLRFLIRRFEARSLPRAAWDHWAHLAVAAWYVSGYDETMAARCVIEGIHAYNRAHGVPQTPSSGYHHTVTLFWLRCVRWVLQEFEGSRLEAVNRVLAVLGRRRELIFTYYSRSLLASWKARLGWVEPDLVSFP